MYFSIHLLTLIKRMKKLLVILFVSSALLSCGGAQSDEHTHEGSGTHSHADGAEHADHQQAPATQQEEFEVGTDSLSRSGADSTHTHGPDGHTH